MAKLTVLVVGATSQQGSAVVRALLHGGHNVRALTRSLAHPLANTLRMRGARLAWTDLDDVRRLGDAVAGVDAVYAMTSPREEGTEVETRRGLLLAELAVLHGVAHFVYSSHIGAAGVTGVPHFDSKREVEQYLRTTGLPHTVVCPAFFMENLLSRSWLSYLQQGILSVPLSPRRKLQQIAVADVGRFVRLVLERRDEFLGRRVPIASDEQTPLEMAATLARITGQPTRHVMPDRTALRERSPSLAAMYEWLDDNPGGVDVAGLRRDYPEINWHTLDGWARRQDWSVLETSASS